MDQKVPHSRDPNIPKVLSSLEIEGNFTEDKGRRHL